MHTTKRDGTNIPQCLANLPRYHPARQSFPILHPHNKNNTVTPTNSPSQSVTDSDSESDEQERFLSPPPPYYSFTSHSEQLDTLSSAEEGRYIGMAAKYHRKVYVAEREKMLRKMQKDHVLRMAAIRRQREHEPVGQSNCIVVFFIAVIVLWVLVLLWLFLDKASSG